MQRSFTPHCADGASGFSPLPPNLSWAEHSIIAVHFFGVTPITSVDQRENEGLPVCGSPSAEAAA